MGSYASQDGYKINRSDLWDQIQSVTLGEDQENAISGLIDWFETWKEHGEAAILKGNPGTGKSFTLVQFILNLVNLRKCQRTTDFQVILTAPTNQAKENIRDFSQANDLWRYTKVKVSTTFALAGMMLDGLDDQGYGNDIWRLDAMKQEELSKIKLVVVDEYSMNDEILYEKLTPFMEYIPFLFVGDLNQLDAVPNKKYGKKLPIGESAVDNNNPNFIYELKEPQRFSGNILRYTYEVLESYDNPDLMYPPLPSKTLRTGEDLIVMDRDEFISNEMEKFTSNPLFWDSLTYCKVLCFTNNAVSNWNKILRSTKYNEEQVHFLHEEETLIVKEPVYSLIDEKLVSVFYTNQKFKAEAVEDCMINIEIAPHLGTLPFQRVYAFNKYNRMTEFLVPTREALPSLVQYFMIRFNELNIMKAKAKTWEEKKNQKIQWDLWESALRLYGLAYTKDPNERKPIKRQVIPYYAGTIHSMQGTTLNTAILDWKDIRSARNPRDRKKLAYVASSRPKERLIILT
jgi:hypothetical protein